MNQHASDGRNVDELAVLHRRIQHEQDERDAVNDSKAERSVYGYFQMARAAVPHLAGGSAIINSGSVTASKVVRS